MDRLKRWITLLLAAALSVILSACTIPMPGFADYDVSGYIEALLDSSYHDANEELMAVAKITEEKARENNKATVENAAVTFCNTYQLSPSDEQLEELQKIMKQAFALTKYTVKDERKVETGYYLEVEVASITNFAEREEEIEKLRTQARQEATSANTSWSSSGVFSQAEEPTSEEPASSASQRVDANALFVDKVLDFCKQELANISYDPETRSFPLDILQTEDGELQLDLNQIDSIDRAVVRFD